MSVDTLHVSASFIGVDTIHRIPLIGSSQVTMPFTPPIPMQFDSVATCSHEDTILQIRNLGCSIMAITNLYSLSKDWIITDTSGNPLQLPISIPIDSAVSIRIRFKPQSFGYENSRITIQYHYYGVDSLATFAIYGTGTTPGELTYSRRLDFGPVSLCSSLDTVLTFHNGSCQPDRIDTIMVNSPFYILDSTSFPIVVDEGKTVRIRVRYSPSHKGGDSYAATLKMMMNGLLLFDSLNLSGVATAGLSSFSTTLSHDSISFKPRSECDAPDSVIFFINNPGCDSLTINSLTLEGNTTPALVLEQGISLPTKIQGSDSIRVAISIERLVPGGYKGTLHASFTLADGTSKDTLIPVSAVITAGTRTISIDTTGVNLGSGSICAVHDTVLHYTNTGCLPVTILGWRMTHWNGFNVAGSGKYPPLTLQPNESDSIYITYSGTMPGSYYDTVFFSCGTDKDSGRSIPVSVIIRPVDSLHFELIAPPAIKAGQSFTTEIRPAKNIATEDLRQIAGVLSYPDNNFVFESLTATSPLQLQYQGPFVSAHTAHIPFTLTSTSPITFDTLLPVLTLTREAMITDTIDYSVLLDSILFNGDPNYQRCTLATGEVTTVLSLNAACPDPLIINSLSGHPLLLAGLVKPNPVTSDAQYRTELSLQALENGMVTIVLSDAVGRIVYTTNRYLQKNTVDTELFDLMQEPAGCYFYSVRFNSLLGSAANSGTLILKR